MVVMVKNARTVFGSFTSLLTSESILSFSVLVPHSPGLVSELQQLFLFSEFS